MEAPPIWWGNQHQRHGFGALRFPLDSGLKFCMEYQAEVHETLIGKLLLGWVAAVKKTEAEEDPARRRLPVKRWDLKNRARGKSKNGSRATAFWAK